MPTCTPQLCFGETGPSYNGEPDYASYSLNLGVTINLGKFEIKDGFCQWGVIRKNYPGSNPEYDIPFNEFHAYKVYHFFQTLNAQSSIEGKKPHYKFTPRDRAEILQDITDAISGENPEEVEDSIKNEIVDRLRKIIDNDNCQEVCSDLVNFKKSQFNYIDEGNQPAPAPSPFSAPTEGIAIYKAIAGGQVRFTIKEDDRHTRTQFYFFRQIYDISVILTSVDFCKKVDDQFPLDLSLVQLDPKWQKEFVQDDPKLTLCDCLQMTYSAENIIKTQIPMENFLEPESAAIFAAEAVTSNQVTNVVMNGFGPLVNPSSALALMQAMASAATNDNELRYGYLGRVIGFLTKHTTLDGPLVEIGWVIPLTADTNGKSILDALSSPLIRIGLNEARQLATNPYGYFQTVTNSLAAAGFGPTIPGYGSINQDIANRGLPTVDQTATNIDLNGTVTTTNSSRTEGAGVVNDRGSGGNPGGGFQIVPHRNLLDSFLRNGTRQQGF